MVAFEDIQPLEQKAHPSVISLLGEVFDGVSNDNLEQFKTQKSVVESKPENNNVKEDNCEKYSIGVLNFAILAFMCFILLNITNLSVFTTRITNKFIMCFLETLLIVSMFWLYVKFTV